MATYNCFAIARGTYSGEIDASKSNNLIQSAKEAAECAYCGENKKMHIYISPIMSPTVKNRYKFTATIVLMLEGKMSARSQKEAFDLFKEQCKDRNFGLLKDVFCQLPAVKAAGLRESVRNEEIVADKQPKLSQIHRTYL